MSLNSSTVLNRGMEGRLDTGMRVDEAVRRASAWWDHKGRHLAKSELRKRFVSDNPDSENHTPNGILLGLPWDDLGCGDVGRRKMERMKIVKVWHHFAVRRPDKLGIESDDPFTLGHGETVN